MSDIIQLIENGELEKRDDTVLCPGCDMQAEFFQHIYDDEVIAQYCENCGTAEWIEQYGKKDNPRRCPVCEEFVNDSQIKKSEHIECSNQDDFHGSCEQLSHKKCVEFCSKCGWFCDTHTSNQIQCDSCGLYHNVNHFVSFGNDFVGTFGNICQDCFSEDEETYADDIDDDPSRVGTLSDEELQAEKEIRKKNSAELTKEKGKKSTDFHLKKAGSFLHATIATIPADRKRSDSSIYLSHFMRKKDGMTDKDCLEQLIKILNDNKIESRPTGYFSTYKKILSKTAISKAVCLTDGRISALKEHAEDYSEFGISFLKFDLLRKHQAAPAAYIHHSIIEIIKNQIPDELVPYVNMIKADGYNYHHEREWRIPNDLTFDHDDIFVIFAPEWAHDSIRKTFKSPVRLVCIESIINL